METIVTDILPGIAAVFTPFIPVVIAFYLSTWFETK